MSFSQQTTPEKLPDLQLPVEDPMSRLVKGKFEEILNNFAQLVLHFSTDLQKSLGKIMCQCIRNYLVYAKNYTRRGGE